jgi:hypothetical protein
MTAESQRDRGEEEISKKDILRETGVSYGQFYRWKRMALIPEAWFRRRSTFTGQESFLPREKILERIRRIQELKDRYSLDDIAEMLSPDAVRRSYSPAEVESMSWLSPQAKGLTREITGRDEWDFLDILCARMVGQLLEIRDVTQPVVRLAATVLLDRYDELDQTTSERVLVVATRDDTMLAALHAGACLFDRDTKVIVEINLGRLAEEVKVRLREFGGPIPQSGRGQT